MAADRDDHDPRIDPAFPRVKPFDPDRPDPVPPPERLALEGLDYDGTRPDREPT